MKLAVLICVFAATCSSISCKNLQMQESIFKDIGKIKLPTAIKDNYEIQINGTLNTEHNSFTVSLPESRHSENCRITHQFDQNKICVSPSPKDTNPWQIYEIETTSTDIYNFILTLQARSVNNSEFLEVTYEIIGNGEVLDLRCNVHFQDLSVMVFEEGVLSLHSIMFKFL